MLGAVSLPEIFTLCLLRCNNLDERCKKRAKESFVVCCLQAKSVKVPVHIGVGVYAIARDEDSRAELSFRIEELFLSYRFQLDS